MRASENPLYLLESYETYGDYFMDLRLWEAFVCQICQRHNLEPFEPVRAGLAGTYPTFIVADRWVIKFFGRLFQGAAAYQVELQVNQLIASTNEIQAPPVVDTGNLFQITDSWNWPYLIFKYVPGVSIGQVYGQVSFEDKLTLARQLGRITRKLHQIPLTGTAFESQKGPGGYQGFLTTQRENCVHNHQEWGSLPERLIVQIEDYLLPVEALVDNDGPASLIHADITRDHILGSINELGWQTRALIDFGDAIVGDLFYELVALHLDTFQADQNLLKAYLQSYGISDRQRQDFVHKAMSVTLLHQFHVLEGVRAFLDFEVDSLEALATNLWGNAI